jgi:hypothetical protein
MAMMNIRRRARRDRLAIVDPGAVGVTRINYHRRGIKGPSRRRVSCHPRVVHLGLGKVIPIISPTVAAAIAATIAGAVAAAIAAISPTISIHAVKPGKPGASPQDQGEQTQNHPVKNGTHVTSLPDWLPFDRVHSKPLLLS